MIKAVIIDLDDTLCLTEAACFEMENEVLVHMGLPPMSRNLHLSTWGQPLFEAIKVRSPGIDVVEFKKHYSPAIGKFIESGKLDAIPQENYQALDKLLSQGKQLFVLTSRTHEELNHLLAPDHRLSQSVEAFYYRDKMQYHKPDPRAFAGLLIDHNLEPNKCIYVGDSVSDARAAKEAKLHFIPSLESGIRTKDDFEHLPVDGFINKFPEVVAAVEFLNIANPTIH